MLMMVDKQVHYHVIPRYERDTEFSGITWKDSGWPGVPNLVGEEVEVKTLKKILTAVKDNLTV
jgi:diadenosine tetraphosphate (Ap4A) HIT family hydrolase